MTPDRTSDWLWIQTLGPLEPAVCAWCGLSVLKADVWPSLMYLEPRPPGDYRTTLSLHRCDREDVMRHHAAADQVDQGNEGWVVERFSGLAFEPDAPVARTAEEAVGLAAFSGRMDSAEEGGAR